VVFGYSVGAHVLHGVSFSVAGGQTVALVGATGSGKARPRQNRLQSSNADVVPRRRVSSIVRGSRLLHMTMFYARTCFIMDSSNATQSMGHVLAANHACTPDLSALAAIPAQHLIVIGSVTLV